MTLSGWTVVLCRGTKKEGGKVYLSTLSENKDLSRLAKICSLEALRRSRWHFLQYSAAEKLFVLQSGQIMLSSSFPSLLWVGICPRGSLTVPTPLY